MKWTLKPWPKDGEMRERTFFAWLPIIDDVYGKGCVIWWLEQVIVMQKYFEGEPGDPGGWLIMSIKSANVTTS